MDSSRRHFIQSLVGASLVPWLGLEVVSTSGCHVFSLSEKSPQNALAFLSVRENLQIPSSLQFVMMCPRQEMGQGAETIVAMLLAEELTVPLEEITVEFLENPDQLGFSETVGSESVRQLWVPLRMVGATARELFLQAGAKVFNQAVSDCFVRNGFVLDSSGRQISFLDLWSQVQKEPVPNQVNLKPRDQFQLLGQPQVQVAIDSLLQGDTCFSIDFHCDDMLYAMIERAPHASAILNNRSEVLSQLKKADFRLNIAYFEEFSRLDAQLRDGVVLVADHTWPLISARKKVDFLWDVKGYSFESHETQQLSMHQLALKAPLVYQEGKEPANTTSLEVIERGYDFPYLPHLSMEPPNCVVKIENEICDVWVGTQRPKKLREHIAKILEMPLEKVIVHPLRMGGAFGRKAQTDFVVECALIAKKMRRPVKLLWLREDDVQFDFFRPASYQKLRAEFKKTGEIIRWVHTCVMPMRESNVHDEKTILEPTQKDLQQGATDFLLNTQSMQFYAKGVASDVRIGIWRSVNHSFFAHAINCFIDDIAHVCQEHPLDYRLKHLKRSSISRRFQSVWRQEPSQTERMRLVLEKMKEEAKTLYSSASSSEDTQKSAVGFAAHHAFGAVIAIAVKITTEKKQVLIEQIHVVVDAGFIVNPIQALSQIEGGVYFALGAALFGEILIEKGCVKNRNFHDTPILPRYLAPPVTVTWLGQEGAPQGLGEVVVPVVSPALCNAIFAATGQRVTRLPLSHHFTFKIGLT